MVCEPEVAMSPSMFLGSSDGAASEGCNERKEANRLAVIQRVVCGDLTQPLMAQQINRELLQTLGDDEVGQLGGILDRLQQHAEAMVAAYDTAGIPAGHERTPKGMNFSRQSVHPAVGKLK